LTISKQLYQLQLVDLEIEARKEAMSKIAVELAESDLLNAAKGRLQSDREKLAEFEKNQRFQDAEAEDLRAKIKEEEAKTEEAGKSPKELNALLADVDSRKANLKVKEEALIEVMADIEKYRGRVETGVKELAEVEKKWAEDQAVLLGQQAKLQGELEELAKKREAASVGISPEHLALYKLSRPGPKGAAVVKVDRGRCSGCRIALSVSEVQRVRTGSLVRCSNCGRILFLE